MTLNAVHRSLRLLETRVDNMNVDQRIAQLEDRMEAMIVRVIDPAIIHQRHEDTRADLEKIRRDVAVLADDTKKSIESNYDQWNDSLKDMQANYQDCMARLRHIGGLIRSDLDGIFGGASPPMMFGKEGDAHKRDANLNDMKSPATRDAASRR